jgi:hypothetical protein
MRIIIAAFLVALILMLGLLATPAFALDINAVRALGPTISAFLWSSALLVILTIVVRRVVVHVNEGDVSRQRAFVLRWALISWLALVALTVAGAAGYVVSIK